MDYQPLDPNRRCFGRYKCSKCHRSWMSGNSWVGYAQQCTTCKINVHAYEQTPLEKSTNKSDPLKSHPQELCQKCRAIGHFCGSSIYRY